MDPDIALCDMEPDIEPLAAGLSDMAPLDMEPPDWDCANAEPATPKLMNRARAAVFPKVFMVLSSKRAADLQALRSNLLEQGWRTIFPDKAASFFIFMTEPRPRWRHRDRPAPISHHATPAAPRREAEIGSAHHSRHPA